MVTIRYQYLFLYTLKPCYLEVIITQMHFLTAVAEKFVEGWLVDWLVDLLAGGNWWGWIGIDEWNQRIRNQPFKTILHTCFFKLYVQYYMLN